MMIAVLSFSVSFFGLVVINAARVSHAAARRADVVAVARAETIGGGLLATGLVLIGLGLHSSFG